MRTRPIQLFLAVLGSALVLTACGSSDSDGGDRPGEAGKVVTIATHDSWGMDKKVMAAFTAKTGITVRIAKQGDAGQLTNKLVLTKGNPIADGVFGIDNTFASRAIDEGVLDKYVTEDRPSSVAEFDLEGDNAAYLNPIDYGDVCVNIDDTWFAQKGMTPPKTLEDLVDPTYKGLFVTPGATTSSPGLAFLLATVGAFGDDWPSYWEKLVANDVKVDAGWTDAYTVDFTAGGGNGSRPIVLSYSSSPPFTVPEGGDEPTTSALLDTCFRQVEYAGVLDGAKNPAGAQKFIDFMLTQEFQQALPDNMYVYPVDTTAPLPEGWDVWAKTATKPFTVPEAEITENRADWLREWRDIATG